MGRIGRTAICLMILTLAGCSQATTDPAKPASDKAAAPVSQSATPDSGGRGGDGGGGY